jgi:hypothetical protein
MNAIRDVPSFGDLLGVKKVLENQNDEKWARISHAAMQQILVQMHRCGMMERGIDASGD